VKNYREKIERKNKRENDSREKDLVDRRERRLGLVRVEKDWG
jgi:hypothetical protein